MRGTTREVALEDAVRPPEAVLHPDRPNLVDELQLLGKGGVLLDAQDVVRRDVATHAAVADQVVAALLVLGNPLGHIADEVHLHVLDGWLRAAPPVGYRVERNGLLTRLR